MRTFAKTSKKPKNYRETRGLCKLRPRFSANNQRSFQLRHIVPEMEFILRLSGDRLQFLSPFHENAVIRVIERRTVYRELDRLEGVFVFFCK